MAKISDKPKTKKCPECGSKKIGLGCQNGYAAMRGITGAFFEPSSEIRAEICCNCGLIIRQWVKSPEKFLAKENKSYTSSW